MKTDWKTDFREETLLSFYRDHLVRSLVPFWTKAADHEYGGFFTCFTNEGNRLASTDKYVWSQGRLVWVFAKLAAGEALPYGPAERTAFMELARMGARFLMEHCLLENGSCAFLLGRDGTPKPADESGRLDVSIFADGFVVLGLSKYAAAAGDRKAFAFALELYDSIGRRLAENRFMTHPYPIPKGYRAHSVPMIMLNVTQELLEAAEALDADPEGRHVFRLRGALHRYLDEVFTFADENGVLHEMRPVAGSGRGSDAGSGTGGFRHAAVRDGGPSAVGRACVGKESGTAAVADEGKETGVKAGEGISPKADAADAGEGRLLDRYCNPGHALEDMWFAIHAARKLGREGEIRRAAMVIRKMLEIGWDAECGGLFLFADQDGGPPKGGIAGCEREPMVLQIQSNWDNKLWWVHSEALYASLLGWQCTGDDAFLHHYRRLHEYVFSTFPHPDPAIGEWIQIRDRLGRPVQKVVALPVKDPFHIIRNVILIIELLANRLERNGTGNGGIG